MQPINSAIERARTLSGSFYHDPNLLEISKEQIFASSWQLVAGAEENLRRPYDAWPFSFMDNFIDEPLLLLRDADDTVRCFSNVCTHRGKILVENPTRLPGHGIICGYHGRRFSLDGRFAAMPEMQGVEDFPCPADDLAALPVGLWHQFAFASLAPAVDFAAWIGPLERKVGFLPLDEFRYQPARSRDYLVRAHWALYVDNYLEGFHIPFVHKSLNATLDWSAYRTELFEWGNCQVGVARGGEQTFDLPPGHEDHGQQIAAYYFWLFPNIMFNFYPWGLSLNIVRPLQTGLTRVSFRAYVWDESRLDQGAGADVDLVEREDEAVVEQVQRGTRSRFYRHGRFSAKQERGVHQFHRMLARSLDGA